MSSASYFNRRNVPVVPRIVDGLPAPRPIRVPSRFGLKIPGFGSASASPKVPTPVAPKNRPNKLRLAFQYTLLAVIVLVALKQLGVVRGTAKTAAGSGHKRQAISGEEDSALRTFGVRSSAFSRRHGYPKTPFTYEEEMTEDKSPGGFHVFPAESSQSAVFAHTIKNGRKTSQIYRFTNVRISTIGEIEYFGGPNGLHPPFLGAIVDLGVTSNLSSGGVLLPPTVLRAYVGSGRSKDIPVQYLSEERSTSACTRWIEGPTLLLHVRPSQRRDMWRTWSEGLLPAFQTLREMGHLPLMEVDVDGQVRHVTRGVPSDECPKPAILNQKNTTTGTKDGPSYQTMTGCLLRSSFAAKLGHNTSLCDSNQTWCVPGVWPHIAVPPVMRPSLLLVDQSAVDNEWAALYSAFAGGGVRLFSDAHGTCLRNVIVGMTQTIDLRGVPPTFASNTRGQKGNHGKVTVDEGIAVMADALDVFARFMHSGLRRLAANNAIDFSGYSKRFEERLRRGVRVGEGWAIDKSFRLPRVIEDPGAASPAILEDWTELSRFPWIFEARWQQLSNGGVERHENKTDSSLNIDHKSGDAGARVEAARATRPSPLLTPGDGPSARSSTPVVTYITRWHTLSRAVLNDRQILRYILARYNVTVRVTALTEHAGVVADTLSSTDVLIGMHGTGWTHALFLKPGGVALRLHPYGWHLGPAVLCGKSIAWLTYLRGVTHIDWVNPYPEYSFFRREEFADDTQNTFREHPSCPGDSPGDAEWVAPNLSTPHAAWLYANTYADRGHLGAYIDEAMKAAGIPKVDPVALRASAGLTGFDDVEEGGVVVEEDNNTEERYIEGEEEY